MSLESEEPPLSSAVVGAAAVAAAVLVYNCTSSKMSSLQVNFREFAAGGIPGMEGSGSPPSPLSYVSVPLCDLEVNPSCAGFYIGLSGSTVSVAFNGVNRWAQNVIISQAYAGNTIYMWCFINGFVISDAQGRLHQMYVQLATSTLAKLLTSDQAYASPPEEGEMKVYWTGDAISVLL